MYILQLIRARHAQHHGGWEPPVLLSLVDSALKLSIFPRKNARLFHLSRTDL